MMPAEIDIPHFSFPFRRTPSGSVAVVDQDSLGHVDVCAQVVIRCPEGFRDERPEFGWPFPEFSTTPIDTRPIAEALVKFGHPLGTPDVTEYSDTVDQAVRFLDILEKVQA